MYDCDALLPTADRYASLKFRRVSRWFRPTKLDWSDALELVTFVETIGLDCARWVFHWDSTGPAGVNAYRRLKRHVHPDHLPYVAQNEAELGPHVGVAVFHAMLDGGFPLSKHLPRLIKRSIRQLRHEGMGPAAIARLFRVPLAKVESVLLTKRGNGRAKATASLGIG